MKALTALLAAAAVVLGGAAPAAAQLPPLPAPVQSALDSARAGSADAEAGSARAADDARTAATGALVAAGILPPPPPADPVPQSPCPRTASACIDLAGQRSWLQSGGRRDYGPVPISSGRPGWETPRGTFRVTSKVRDEVSREFGNAPMPYSVYFTTTGIAFHEGDVAVASHGCIHLSSEAAQTYFPRLRVGDEVVAF